MGKIAFFSIKDCVITLEATKEYIVDYIVDTKATENGFVYVDIGDDESDIRIEGLCDWSVTLVHGNLYKAFNAKTAERAPFMLDNGIVRLLSPAEVRMFNTAIKASLRHVFHKHNFEHYMQIMFNGGINGLFTELKREFISLYLGEVQEIKE